MRIKILFLAGIMAVAAVAGIFQGLTAPRRDETKEGKSSEESGEKKLPSQ